MKESVNNTKKIGKSIAIIGGGPAGLMAAQEAIKWGGGAGLQVDVYDAMPSVGRKFLLAGKGGLNLTHSEAAQPFVSRYGARSGEIGALLQQFGAADVQAWAHGLGVETFVGSSGRGVSQRHEGGAVAAGLVASIASQRGAVSHAASVAGVGGCLICCA